MKMEMEMGKDKEKQQLELPIACLNKQKYFHIFTFSGNLPHLERSRM